MSDLGFTGAAGVGRPFTIQDLFAAVAQQPTSSSTAINIINQYLDIESESITIADVFSTLTMAPVGYDTGTWQEGSWT